MERQVMQLQTTLRLNLWSWIKSEIDVIDSKEAFAGSAIHHLDARPANRV